MINCPDCGNLIGYNSHFQNYFCNKCGYLGNGMSSKCTIEFERPVNETLWYAIMTCAPYEGVVYGDNPDHTYENDTFVVKSYDWSDEENTNDWHFWHKPSGFKLQWYKYPMRSPLVNMEITHEQFYAVLHDCMNSVHPKFTVQIEEWW